MELKKIFLQLFKKPSDLTVNVLDFNLIPRKPALLKKLRSLTINHKSGMNHELNTLLPLTKQRKVNAKIIVAKAAKNIVGWALISKEKSDFYFMTGEFDPVKGHLFQVFVDPDYRRKGIGSLILKEANKQIGRSKLCVAPWNITSTLFFNKFKKIKTIVI